MKSLQVGVSRRQALQAMMAGVAAWHADCSRSEKHSPPLTVSDVKGAVRVEVDGSRPLISFLSWDTEGGNRVKTNLLRAKTSVGVRVSGNGQAQAARPAISTEATGAQDWRFIVSVSPESKIVAEVHAAGDRFSIRVAAAAGTKGRMPAMELVFPFDPRVTATTVLASEWKEDGTLRLPGIISAPDYGQMLVSDPLHRGLHARLEGSRDQQFVDLIIELPGLAAGETYNLEFGPARLDPPEGLEDVGMWQRARRGWFNVWQPSARWGEQDRPHSAPAGLLSNNVISDPVSFVLAFYADFALWTPLLPGGISAAAHVRSTLDWWIGHRMLPSGEVIGYWDVANFLDANPSLLIAAWDYVEATGDKQWLAGRIERLEFLADFLAGRDIDHDGMVEATQSGNYGTLRDPARSSCWWDALNTGYKDGYSNALIYRAWRCLAELERQLGRSAPQQRYSQLADRLKAVYSNCLFNAQTGWLGWWRSADGELHDYASPVVNGLAIEYGLVSPAEGRRILARLRSKMQTLGLNRYDLGFPGVLLPVRRGDYLLPDGLGVPSREDGTDTFGQYMNGGISAGQGSHFVNAHFVVGEQDEGDKMLLAMLGREAEGGFQNGVRNQGGKGADWTTWQGEPCGYEGYLSDLYILLHGVLLREPRFRARFYRPLGT